MTMHDPYRRPLSREVPPSSTMYEQPNSKMTIRLGELFCGPGGLGMGAKLAGVAANVRVVHQWANDIDSFACKTYQRNVADSRTLVIPGDVSKLNVESLPPIDGLLFGFPCNDFSLVGENQGLEGKFGNLYKHGVDVLNKHEPLFFVAENVSGIKSSNSGEAFKQILGELRTAGSNGYNLIVHQYEFQYYGVPQNRKRVIVVGFRSDYLAGKSYQPPAPSNHIKTARQALNKIPPSAPNHEITRLSEAVETRLRFIPPGGNAWSQAIPEEFRLNVKGAKLSNIYKRLDPDKPAYTVTGSGGGGTHIYHWDEDRALTNRERARLQTFPDNFEFMGGRGAVRKQIGMAVPVIGAKSIMTSIFLHIREVKYPSIEPNLGAIPANA